MDETRLVLLMDDGPVSVVSEGTLTPEQYADLHAVVQETGTIGELTRKAEGLSVAWSVPVTVERVRKAKDQTGD